MVQKGLPVDLVLIKIVNIKEIKRKPGVENTIFRYQVCLITLSEYMSNWCELLKVGH